MLYVLAIFGGLVMALSPEWLDMRTKHSWDSVPQGWEWADHPQVGTTIDLYIALKSEREDALTDALYEVSTPGHQKQVLSVPRLLLYSCVPLLRSRYGQHLSKEQVAELVAPHPNTLNLVHSWLEDSGIPPSSISLTLSGSSLKLAEVSLSQANDLLGASYQLYRHAESNETIVRTTSYALPAILHEHVHTVVPTTCFDSPRTQRQKPRKHLGREAKKQEDLPWGEPVMAPSSRDVIDATLPAFLRWLYSTWAYSPLATSPSRLGIVGYLWQYPTVLDLRLFMRKYRSDGADATFDVVLVNNGFYDANDPGFEAEIDMQCAQGIAYPIRHIFYSTGRGPSGTEDWYLSFLRTIVDAPSIPQTISLSYGNDEGYYSLEYANHVCRLFARLGARGVSVIQASGDDGVGPGNCRDRSGYVQFRPNFPASCTCCLSSYLARVQVHITHYDYMVTLPQVPLSLPLAERRTINQRWQLHSPAAASRTYFCARYISNKSCPPSSKTSAISIRACTSTFASVTLSDSFLQCNLYSPYGRGIPDISAQALGLRTFFDGNEYNSFGTSAAAPVSLFPPTIWSPSSSTLLTGKYRSWQALSRSLMTIEFPRVSPREAGSTHGCTAGPG